MLFIHLLTEIRNIQLVLSMSNKIREYELCLVCGDKAIGYNFDAISCVSCKAFFRRNALKYNDYKCFLGGGCNIDITNRTTCKRCRLDKCFVMGMKPHLILTDEQKQMRNAIIKANRRRKGKKLSKVVESEPQSTDTETQNCLDFLEIENFKKEEINKEILKIQNYISDNNTTDISDTVVQTALEFELSVLPIDRPITDYRNNFTEFESNKWTELLNALQLIPNPLAETSVLFDRFCEALPVLRIKYEQEVRKIINMSKCLTAFRNINQSDQIVLLKYSSTEIYKLRSILYFNFDGNYWNIVTKDDNPSGLIKLELFREGKYEIYKNHKDFIFGVGKEWDSDHYIIDLLSAILLFDPNLPNLMNRDEIKLQQHIYMYLLQRYLLLRYRSESEAKFKFLRLLNSVTVLHLLNRNLAIKCLKSEIPIDNTPLIKEICDRIIV